MSSKGYLAAALLLLALPGVAAGKPRVEHVVIVIVDGLRPDAIEAAGARNILALARRGARTDTARAVERPETLPSLTTLATGLPPSRHGVISNHDRTPEPAVPTIFTRASEEGLRTGLYFGKAKLAILAPRGSADVSFGPGLGDLPYELRLMGPAAARFAADFPRERFGLSLVHFREPDHAGHDAGWMSRSYLAAVRDADAAVGTVLQAIKHSGVAGQTAILLTADHGGEGTSHGSGRGEASWLVPFICSMPGQGARAIAAPVTMLDVAPTVLALLDLPPLPGATGKPIKECL